MRGLLSTACRGWGAPNRYGSVLALAVLLALGIPAGASSTTVREGSLFEDLEWADAVVTATIGSSRVEADPRGIPQTVYELRGVEGIKGGPRYPFEIRIDGGVLDDGFGLEVPGTPKFAAGDRVLLFLRLDNPIAPIIGLQARSFRIAERDGEAIVTTYDGRPVLGLDVGLRIEAAPAKQDRGLTLRQFASLLREMMAFPEYQERSR
jgi:hypothetical protein